MSRDHLRASEKILRTLGKREARPDARREPIIDLVKDLEVCYNAWLKLCLSTERAQLKAEKKYGRCPDGLILWRTRHVGEGELENARIDFLGIHGVNRKTINAEFREAKARLRAQIRARTAWERRTGLARLNRLEEAASLRLERAQIALAFTRPATVLGAATMLAYVRGFMEVGEEQWQRDAIDNVINGLAGIPGIPSSTRKFAFPNPISLIPSRTPEAFK